MDNTEKSAANPIKYKPATIVDKQIIKPMSIGSSSLSNNNIKNTGIVPISVSIPNNSTSTITHTVASSVNASIRLLGIPQLALFMTSVSTANLLPGANTGWTITGPMAMPEAITGFTGTNDGNNLVFKTWVNNTTGSTQTVLIYADCRYVLAVGGTAPAP